MKNHGDHGVDNWVIDWIGFLPGKRESRRYVGDHILTQNDIMAQGRFDDLVAYGGWSMDDHHLAGFKHLGYPTTFHSVPSPFGIPYRCLYSKNIENLFFAGRNISTTHAAMSATRVMGTCNVIGQAVGTAAAIAVKKGLTPRGVYEKEIATLQKLLMEDDCYLLWHKREIPELTMRARILTSQGCAEVLRNGFDRPIGSEDNGWTGSKGDWVEYTFEKAEHINEIRFVFDSDLNREIKNMPCFWPLEGHSSFHVPHTLVKDFQIATEDG
ncbi:MAG: FAD-dependent oxidoreductase [Firmicutes bacterium]|nr:FAD-dependent oxidoreductase [Bacillota bacterium]